MQDEWISKKDLLAQTGISYGQLYRWKRERLIPDEWFEKRSAFTGQETFFPRERILTRIQYILDNKDRYTLAELLEHLSPTTQENPISEDTLSAVPELQQASALLAELLGSAAFDHPQTLMISMAADARKRASLTDEEARELLKALLHWQASQRIFDAPKGKVSVIRAENRLIPVFLSSESAITPPPEAKVVFERAMADVAEVYTLRLYQLQKEEAK